MKSEKEKMISGDLYNPADTEVSKDRNKAHLLFHQYNQLPNVNSEEQQEILAELIPTMGNNCCIEPPFFCDYGYNIILGSDIFINYNCTILDCAQVHIGSRTMLGPGVQIYTVTHPVNARERASLLEFAKPIEIGEDVWLGGSVVVLPGVKIGNRAVVGAGSVVTKDIPDDVIAAGNPCRIIRRIDND